VRRFLLIIFSTLVLLVRCFPEDATADKSGSIRGEVVTGNQNGEPVVLPASRAVLHGPVNKETLSDAKGAFVIDGLPPEPHGIEASAPLMSKLLTVDVSTRPFSIVRIQMNAVAINSTTSTQKTQLAMDYASSRKVHHA
jgi:hypothetical protein